MTGLLRIPELPDFRQPGVVRFGDTYQEIRTP